MQRYRIEQMTLGYFIGDFFPAVLRTPHFEVGYKVHRQWEAWPRHYQQQALEINFLVRGMLVDEVSGERFVDGDLWTVAPGEHFAPTFVSECQVVVVKVPSLPADKVVVP